MERSLHAHQILIRANIDALKQLRVTDIVYLSRRTCKENLPPGKFVIDQFIDRTFARNKLFLMMKL